MNLRRLAATALALTVALAACASGPKPTPTPTTAPVRALDAAIDAGEAPDDATLAEIDRAIAETLIALSRADDAPTENLSATVTARSEAACALAEAGQTERATEEVAAAWELAEGLGVDELDLVYLDLADAAASLGDCGRLLRDPPTPMGGGDYAEEEDDEYDDEIDSECLFFDPEDSADLLEDDPELEERCANADYGGDDAAEDDPDARLEDAARSATVWACALEGDLDAAITALGAPGFEASLAESYGDLLDAIDDDDNATEEETAARLDAVGALADAQPGGAGVAARLLVASARRERGQADVANAVAAASWAAVIGLDGDARVTALEAFAPHAYAGVRRADFLKAATREPIKGSEIWYAYISALGRDARGRAAAAALTDDPTTDASVAKHFFRYAALLRALGPDAGERAERVLAALFAQADASGSAALPVTAVRSGAAVGLHAPVLQRIAAEADPGRRAELWAEAVAWAEPTPLPRARALAAAEGLGGADRALVLAAVAERDWKEGQAAAALAGLREARSLLTAAALSELHGALALKKVSGGLVRAGHLEEGIEAIAVAPTRAQRRDALSAITYLTHRARGVDTARLQAALVALTAE